MVTLGRCGAKKIPHGEIRSTWQGNPGRVECDDGFKHHNENIRCLAMLGTNASWAEGNGCAWHEGYENCSQTVGFILEAAHDRRLLFGHPGGQRGKLFRRDDYNKTHRGRVVDHSPLTLACYNASSYSTPPPDIDVGWTPAPLAHSNGDGPAAAAAGVTISNGAEEDMQKPVNTITGINTGPLILGGWKPSGHALPDIHVLEDSGQPAASDNGESGSARVSVGKWSPSSQALAVGGLVIAAVLAALFVSLKCERSHWRAQAATYAPQFNLVQSFPHGPRPTSRPEESTWVPVRSYSSRVLEMDAAFPAGSRVAEL